MLRTLEAVVEPDGRVRLLEPLGITTSHRALVTVLEESGTGADPNPATLLRELAPAEWNARQDDAVRSGQVGAKVPMRGLSGDELRRFAGTISSEDLDIMQRVIEEEFERIGW